MSFEGSDEYRDVLRSMSDYLDSCVTKAEIRKNVRIKESTLNNAIAALKKRHIILAKPGVAGTYRLPTKAFAVWIRAFTNARQEVLPFQTQVPLRILHDSVVWRIDLATTPDCNHVPKALQLRVF